MSVGTAFPEPQGQRGIFFPLLKSSLPGPSRDLFHHTEERDGNHYEAAQNPLKISEFIVKRPQAS